MSTAVAPVGYDGGRPGVTNPLVRIKQELDRSLGELAKALPKHLSAERMARIALTTIRNNPEIQKCNPISVIGSIVRAAQMGLEVDNGQAYLVPFKGQCQLIVGYRGMATLAYRSGMVLSLYADVVREKDRYSVSLGTNPVVVHEPFAGDAGQVIAAYAVAVLRGGVKQVSWMWRHEIDARRARSSAGSKGPWNTDFAAMAKKSAVRQLCPLLPCSAEMNAAIALDADFDGEASSPVIDAQQPTRPTTIDALAESMEPGSFEPTNDEPF